MLLVEKSHPLMPCMKTFWASISKRLAFVLACDAKQQTLENAKIKLVL